MLKNYLKIAIRNILKNKLSASISIASLTAAFTFTFLIIQYVTLELSYDKYQETHNNIYRISTRAYNPETSDVYHGAGAIPVLAEEVKQFIPEIEATCRVFRLDGGNNFKPNENVADIFNEPHTYYVDSTVFEFFPFQLIEGNADRAFRNSYDVWISKQLADRYFNPDNYNQILGKDIQIMIFGNYQTFTIQGIFHKKANSHFQPEMMVSSMHLEFMRNPVSRVWDAFMTYLKFTPGADIGVVKDQIDKYYNKNHGWIQYGLVMDHQLQPIGDIYLHAEIDQDIKISGGDPFILKTLVGLSLVILLCALINVINIKVALGLQRSKEIGVRKVSGANRRQLLQQFLMESGILVLISIILALNLNSLIYPHFLPLLKDQTISSNLLFPVLYLHGSPNTLFFGALLVVIFGVTTFITAFHPSFILSSVKTSLIIKGLQKNERFQPGHFRRLLLGFQFVVSAFLIIAIYVAYYQIDFMVNQDFGFGKNSKIVIAPPGLQSEQGYLDRARQFKSALRRLKNVEMVSGSSSVPDGHEPKRGLVLSFTNDLNDAIKPSDRNFHILIDNEFLNAYNHQLLAGRNFTTVTYSDSALINSEAIVNESQLKELGFESPDSILNRTLYGFFSGVTYKLNVVGVIKDFHQETLHTGLRSAILMPSGMTFSTPDANKAFFENDHQYFTVDLNSERTNLNDISITIEAIQEQWQRFFPDLPFNYSFMDDRLQSNYKREINFLKLVVGITFTIMVIAALGLFSLSSLLIQRRTKEIGIRKVLGASTHTLLQLLSRDFVMLVAVCSLIGLPLAYYAIDLWLKDFAYRIDVYWWMLVIPILVLFIIALVTISYHAVKTARANPVKALRFE